MHHRNTRVNLRIATLRRRLQDARQLKRAYTAKTVSQAALIDNQNDIIASHEHLVLRMRKLHNKIIPTLISLYDEQEAKTVRLLDEIVARAPEALAEFIAGEIRKANEIGELKRSPKPRDVSSFLIPPIATLFAE